MMPLDWISTAIDRNLGCANVLGLQRFLPQRTAVEPYAFACLCKGVNLFVLIAHIGDQPRPIIDAATKGLSDRGEPHCDSQTGHAVAAEVSGSTKRGIEMSEQDNKEAIERGYAAFASGDVETVMSLFDDDIEWVQPGDSTVSGTFHGKTEVMEHLGRMAEKGLTVKLNQLIAEGDTVVALTEVTAGGETGQDADVFIVRNGKTVEVRTHGDTALMERVYGKKQLAAG
jgi:ketosteroid isomerase-like protein